MKQRERIRDSAQRRAQHSEMPSKHRCSQGCRGEVGSPLLTTHLAHFQAGSSLCPALLTKLPLPGRVATCSGLVCALHKVWSPALGLDSNLPPRSQARWHGTCAHRGMFSTLSKRTTRVVIGFAELRPLPVTGPVSAFAKDCHPAPGHWSLPGL